MRTASRRCASTAPVRPPTSAEFSSLRPGALGAEARTPGIFRSQAFTRFYIGQVLSYLGFGLRLIAIPLLVYRLTHSAHALGATYACELGPWAVFGLIGGSLADRVDRRRLMMWCDGIRFFVMAAFAVAFAAHGLTLPMLLIGIAIEATAAAGFVNAQTTSIRYLLGKDGATDAAAALVGAEQLSTSVLPPLGAVLFTATGPLPALLLNALTYLVSLGFIASVPTFGPDRAERSAAPVARGFARTTVEDVRAGFSWLVRDPAMIAVTMLSLFFNVFGFVILSVLIPFLKVDLGASDRDVGIVFGVSALGSVAGSLIAARVPKRWPFGIMLVVAYALDGILFLPVIYARDLVVAVIFLGLANVCTLFEIAQIVGWRIRITPKDLVGRVTSAARFLAMIGTVPGALLGGWLGDHIGARPVVAFAGYGYLAIGIAVAFVPAIRNERR